MNLSFSLLPPLPGLLFSLKPHLLLDLFLKSFPSIGTVMIQPYASLALSPLCLIPCSLSLSHTSRGRLSTIRQRSKDPAAESLRLSLAILSPCLMYSKFSDLRKSETDLLGSSLNWGNGLWSAYWSPCCVHSLSHTHTSHNSHKHPSKLKYTKLYRSSLQHALFLFLDLTSMRQTINPCLLV